MAAVKKNRESKKAPREVAAKIAAFRKAKNWTAQALAEKLGLSGPNIIYAWESRSYEPSAENYISMANLAAPDWRYIEWFLRRAGVEDRTLKHTADMLLHSSQTNQIAKLIDRTRDDFVSALAEEAAAEFRFNFAVSPLSAKGGDKLLFPSWALPNPASTRYVQIAEQGDLVLIDTLQTDVRELGEGSFIAIDSGVADSPLIGILRKQSAVQNVEHYMMRLIQDATGDVFLGSSVAARPPQFTRENLVLGCVVAWIKGAGKKK